jgi:hypothetical protein
MRPFLADAMWLTLAVTAAALLTGLGTLLLFRRGKRLEEP